MRVTNQSVYQRFTGEVLRNLEEYSRLQEMISTGKKLRKPSDNPTGIGMSTNFRADFSSYEQYMNNLEYAEDYLKASDGALSGINDILTKAREIAEYHASETSDSGTLAIATDQIQQLINQAFEIANTKVNGKYIFSGYKTDTQAFDNVGRILDPYSMAENSYKGEVSASGNYNGSVNNTYLIRIVNDGALGFAEYQVSEDNGATWSNNRTLLSTNDLKGTSGNDTGIDLTFEGGNFEIGDSFKVYVEKGLYRGDNGTIEVNAGLHSKIDINLTGQKVFEESGFFNTLYKLRNALDNNNIVEISETVEDLSFLQKNIQTEVVKSGGNLNRVEIAKNNLEILIENVESSLSNIEDADMVKIMTKFAQQDSALQYSLTALSKVVPPSLMNYL